MKEILEENNRLKAEVEKLISDNMELVGVIRSLRKVAREDNEKLETVSRELWLWKNGKYEKEAAK
jgi:hypothetical protein